MSKKLSRIMILSFLVITISISYIIDLLLLSMFACFWLGFVVAAIVSKEQESLIFWATSKGVPTGLLMNDLIEEDDKDERTKGKGDGKARKQTE